MNQTHSPARATAAGFLFRTPCRYDIPGESAGTGGDPEYPTDQVAKRCD